MSSKPKVTRKQVVQQVIEENVPALSEKVENVPSMEGQIEESVHAPELRDDIADWQPINTAPRNGKQIVVSDGTKDNESLAYWRRTRAFANATHRWEETGFFHNPITNSKIDFDVLYWREWGAYQ